jgi:hypothetical protein
MAPASAFVKGLRPPALAADSIWVRRALPARVQRRRAGQWRCAPWRRRAVDAPAAGDERGAWRLAKGVSRQDAPPRLDICGGPLLCPVAERRGAELAIDGQAASQSIGAKRVRGGRRRCVSKARAERAKLLGVGATLRRLR